MTFPLQPWLSGFESCPGWVCCAPPSSCHCNSCWTSRSMGVERLVPPNSAEQRRSRLERIFFREREKDLLVSKYRDQCNSRGFRKRREAEVSSAASGQNEGSLLIQGAGMEVQTSAQCNEPICARAETVATPPDDDAISCYSVSAYTTSTPQERRNLLMARLPTPVIGKPGSGSFSARTPRSASSRGGEPERPPSLGDAAYASAATPAPEVLDAIAEAKSVPGPVPEESEASEVDDRQSASLEWSVLDKIAAELHKQDNLRAKQREWELKQKLRQDLDRQMADERLKQERAKVEEQHYLQMQEEHTKLWYLEMEQRAAERQQKIEATQKDRDSQLALLRAKRAEEKAQEKQERQELMDSLHRDIVKDKLDAEERLKARREQVQKAFRETAEATKQRKAQAELLALQEQQQVEAALRRLDPETHAVGSFPMYVLPMEAFMNLTSAKSHRDLKEEGLLVKYEECLGNAIFVSHQWTGFKHPDPLFRQLSVLQKVMSQLLRSDRPDFFSIPQLEMRKDSAAGTDLQNAVDSIPTYVRRSKFFIVLAPPLEHADTGQLLNEFTWKKRGWMRPAGMGDFTVEDDRERVLQEMLHTKLLSLLKDEDIHNYRLLLNMQHVHLKKTMEENLPSLQLADFMEENAFRSLSDREFGWSPICFATLRNDVEVVSEMLRLRTNVNDRVSKHDSHHHIEKGMSLLHIAAQFGCNATLKLLLDENAMLKTRDSLGCTPLHRAGIGNNGAGVQILLKARCNPHQLENMTRSNALFPACAWGNLQGAEALMRSIPDLDKSLALHVATIGNGGAELIAALLLGGADINEPFIQPWPVRIKFEVAAKILNLTQSRFAYAVSNLPHSTPLICALLMESFDCAALLIAAFADPTIPNREGKRALEVAKEMSAPEMILQGLQDLLMSTIEDYDVEGTKGCNPFPKRTNLLVDVSMRLLTEDHVQLSFQQTFPEGFGIQAFYQDFLTVPADIQAEDSLTVLWDVQAALPPCFQKIWLWQVVPWETDVRMFSYDAFSRWFFADNEGNLPSGLQHVEMFSGGVGGWSVALRYLTNEIRMPSRSIGIEIDPSIAKTFAINHSIARARWLALAIRVHSKVPVLPFPTWQLPKTSVNHAPCLRVWDEQTRQTLTITDAVYRVAADPNKAGRHAKTKTPTEILRERVYTETMILPTFMALYGSQHELSQAHLEERSYLGFFMSDPSMPHGARFFHPAEVTLLHGVLDWMFIAHDMKLAWLTTGNSILPIHAMIPLVAILNPFLAVPISIQDAVRAFLQARLTMSDAQVFSIPQGHLYTSSDMVPTQAFLDSLTALQDLEDTDTLTVWIPQEGIRSDDHIAPTHIDGLDDSQTALSVISVPSSAASEHPIHVVLQAHLRGTNFQQSFWFASDLPAVVLEEPWYHAFASAFPDPNQLHGITIMHPRPCPVDFGNPYKDVLVQVLMDHHLTLLRMEPTVAIHDHAEISALGDDLFDQFAKLDLQQRTSNHTVIMSHEVVHGHFHGNILQLLASLELCQSHCKWNPDNDGFSLFYKGELTCTTAIVDFWTSVLPPDMQAALGRTMTYQHQADGVQIQFLPSRTYGVITPVAFAVQISVLAFRTMLQAANRTLPQTQCRPVYIKWLGRPLFHDQVSEDMTIALIMKSMQHALMPTTGDVPHRIIHQAKQIMPETCVRELTVQPRRQAAVLNLVLQLQGGQKVNALKTLLAEVQIAMPELPKAQTKKPPAGLPWNQPKRRKGDNDINPADFDLLETFFKNQDATPCPQISAIRPQTTGICMVTSQQAEPWLSAPDKISSDELGLLVVGKPPQTSLSGEEVVVPCRNLDGHMVLIHCKLYQLGSKDVTYQKGDPKQISADHCCLVAITLHKDDFAADQWAEALQRTVPFIRQVLDQENLRDHVLSIWGRSIRQGKSPCSPQQATTIQVHCSVPEDKITKLLLKSGFNKLYCTPKNAMGRLNTGYQVIWLNCDSCQAAAFSAKLPSPLGLVRGRKTLGIRVKEADFPDAWKILCPQQPLPTKQAGEHVYRIDGLPFGVTLPNMKQWCDKIGWNAQPIRALGPQSMLLRTDDTPPEGPRPAGQPVVNATRAADGPTELRLQAQDQKLEGIENQLKQLAVTQDNLMRKTDERFKAAELREKQHIQHVSHAMDSVKQELAKSLDVAFQKNTQMMDERMSELKHLLLSNKRPAPDEQSMQD
eukprot:s359_g4.t1